MKTFLPLFFALTSLALTSFALAEGLPDVPYLFVEGTAEVQKKADLVSLTFTLSATDAGDVAKANGAVQAQAAKVFTLLKGSEIGDDDVAAGDIRSDDEYEQVGGYGSRGKFLGYRVQREFTVKVRDLAKFPKLVNDLFALNVRYFQGAHGEYSKADEARQEVQAQAVKNARAEADNLAKLSGAKLASVWAISSEPFPMIQNRLLNFNNMGTVAAMEIDGTGKAEAAPKYIIPPVSFTRNVHVIYLISPLSE